MSSGLGPGFAPPYRLWRTTDGGRSWSAEAYYPTGEAEGLIEGCSFEEPVVSSPLVGWVVSACPQPGNEAYPALYYRLRTTDGGRSWTREGSPGRSRMANAGLGWAQWQVKDPSTGEWRWGIFRTTDGGLDWTRVGLVDWRGELHFIDERYGWSILQDGALLRTVDGGRSWQPLDSALVPAASPPGDDTEWLEIPTEYIPISVANAAAVEPLATFEVEGPTALNFGVRDLYVGTSEGRLAVWAGGGRAVPRLPAFGVATD